MIKFVSYVLDSLVISLYDTIILFFADMAGLAPEGSQFDAHQYDAKMKEL